MSGIRFSRFVIESLNLGQEGQVLCVLVPTVQPVISLGPQFPSNMPDLDGKALQPFFSSFATAKAQII